MKIKLNENLPLRLATLLKDLGHDADTVNDERLTGTQTRKFGKRRKNRGVSR